MFRTLILTSLLGVAGLTQALPGATALAAEQAQARTVTLDVENMTCDMCPITVRKALEQVPGVTKAEAKYKGDGVGWSTVTFDPAKTSVEALIRATTNAGYPSHIRER